METIKIESKRTNRNLRVAAYVRGKTSSEFQFNPAMDQVEHFESLIRNHPDWEFAGIYADFNKSGIAVKNRP